MAEAGRARIAARGGARTRRSAMTGAFRTPAGGRVDRARPAAFHLRRQGLCRLRRRHAGFRADRQWRPSVSALVQISPAARAAVARAPRSPTRWSRSTPAPAASRPICARPQIELYDGLVARSQNAWPSLEWDALALDRAVRRPDAGRLLLQDLHAAEGRLGGALRADHPPGGGRRRGAEGGRSRPLRLRIRALRCRRGRRRAGRPRRGARRRPRRRARHAV